MRYYPVLWMRNGNFDGLKLTQGGQAVRARFYMEEQLLATHLSCRLQPMRYFPVTPMLGLLRLMQ